MPRRKIVNPELFVIRFPNGMFYCTNANGDRRMDTDLSDLIIYTETKAKRRIRHNGKVSMMWRDASAIPLKDIVRPS